MGNDAPKKPNNAAADSPKWSFRKTGRKQAYANAYHWVSKPPTSEGGKRGSQVVKPDKTDPVRSLKRKRAVLIALPVFLILCFLLILWREAAIVLIGSKNYYGLIEKQSVGTGYTEITQFLSGRSHPVYNSYIVTGKVQAPGTQTGLPKTFGGYSMDASKLFTDSSFTLQAGENVKSRSVAASFHWLFQGSKLITAQGYINKDKAVINAPELIKNNFYIKPADYPAAKAIFNLPEQLCTQQKKTIDPASLSDSLRAVLSQAGKAIANKDVSIQRNRVLTFGNQTIKCDKITVRLTQAQAEQTLDAMIDAADESTAIQTLVKNDSPYITLLNGMSAGDSSAVLLSNAGLKAAVKRLAIGNVTMTLYVKNGLFGSTVISRQIKTDTGYEITYQSVGSSGTLEMKRLDDKDGDINDIRMDYHNTSAAFSGTMVITKSVAQANKVSDQITFSFDHATRTQLGFYPAKIACTTSNQKGTANMTTGFSLEVTKDGGKTKVQYAKKADGKDQLVVTADIAGSAEILKIPDFDPTISVDPVAEKDKLNGLTYEYGTNLNEIANRIGLSPAS